MKKACAPPKPPRASLQKRQYMEDIVLQAEAASKKDIDVSVESSVFDELPLKTVKDFTEGYKKIETAKMISKLARQVGLVKICGCIEALEQDRDYVFGVIPRDYVIYPRPFKVYCDAENCNTMACVKKYCKADVCIKDLNVTESFIGQVTWKVKQQMLKKLVVSMCKAHFRENFIRDCPSCAKQFGLTIPMKK